MTLKTLVLLLLLVLATGRVQSLKAIRPAMQTPANAEVAAEEDVPSVEILEPCVCPVIREPVCGSDGNVYTNPCMMNCAKISNPDLKGVRMAICLDCDCPRRFQPVCGTKETSFRTLCDFDCETKYNTRFTTVFSNFVLHANTALTFQYREACVDPRGPYLEHQLPAMDDCSCESTVRPVCGSSGNTFDNECKFRCYQLKNPDITLKHEGVCRNRTITNPWCRCPPDDEPVCGSDKSVYRNRCEFVCAQMIFEDLREEDLRTCGLAPRESCVCTFELQPVCGTNGNGTFINFGNNCAFECAVRQDSIESVMCAGVCSCTKEYAPVCGSDRVTYSNRCLLDCAADRNPGLFLDKEGECFVHRPGPLVNTAMNAKSNNTAVPVHTSEPCVCLDKSEPVCGSDAVTYSNECELACEQQWSPGLLLNHVGSCVVNASTVGDEMVPIPTVQTYTTETSVNTEPALSETTIPVSATGASVTTSPIDEVPTVATPSTESPAASSSVELVTTVPESTTETKVNNEPVESVGTSPATSTESVGTSPAKPVVTSPVSTTETSVTDDPVQLVTIPNTKCVCPDILDAVCASDGLSYTNACFFACARRRSPKLYMRYKGHCEVVYPDNCECPGKYPVCGNDGVIYKNLCSLRCSQKTNFGLDLMEMSACVDRIGA